MNEVLNYYKPKIENSKALEKHNLQSNKYFLVSTHREENVDNPGNLRKILDLFNQLADRYKLPVVISTHPRTKKRIENLSEYQFNHLIHFMQPFGFIDYISLQKNAKCVISDSGTISEESAILSFPAISLRQSMERPEAQDAGTIILTGFDTDVVLQSITAITREYEGKQCYTHIPQEYQIANTSWRVLKLIIGNSKLSNKWAGIPDKH